VVASGGTPPATWESELAFPALVAALSRPRNPVPARVMGLWPDAGEMRILEIGNAELEGAAATVAAVVTAVTRHDADGACRYAGDPSDPLGSRRTRAAALSGFPAAVSGISSTTRS